MAKHTHTAHCQACGAEQAVMFKNGNMAKHGYKVAGWGFFMGTCPGSDKAPLEQSKEFTCVIIDSLKASIEASLSRKARLEAGTEIPTECYKGQEEKRDASGKVMRDRYNRRIYLDKFIAWELAADYEQRAEVKRQIGGCELNIRNCTDHIVFLGKCIAEFHGQPLKPVEAPREALQVGDRVIVDRMEVTIEAFTERRVGFRGRTATHVQYTVNGRTGYSLPRYCVKV